MGGPGTNGDGPVVVAAQTDELYACGMVNAHLLTDAERIRAESFRRACDRRDYVAAHLLVRMVAAKLAGVPARQLRLRQNCWDCGGPHGKPEIQGHPGVQVSISHTAGVVAAAAGRCAVGVDIERTDQPRVGPELYDRVLDDHEQAVVASAVDTRFAFLRHWVRKECLVKLGAISIDDLATVSLAHLPLADGVRPLGPSRLHVLDWTDDTAGIVGAAVDHAIPRLVPAQSL